MSNEQEIVQALEETIVNTENVNQDYKKVLTTTGEVDVTLADGSTTPNLNKRVRTVIGEVPMITDGNVTLEDGGNQRGFNTFVKTNGAALPWMPDVEYALHAPVTKSDGTLVQSTVAGNKTNPNVDMTGWAPIGGGIKVVESVADMLAIKSPKDGDVVETKSYYSNNVGGATYYFDSSKSKINNNVSVINGWVIDTKTLNADSAGLISDSAEYQDSRLQAWVDAVGGGRIDLKRKVIKIKRLDLPDDTELYRGSLDVYDFDGGDGGRPVSDWRRTPIMLKNNPRDDKRDFEYEDVYATLQKSSSIKFNKINFRAKNRLFAAYKVDDVEFIKCKLTYDEQEIINIIGGWHGSTWKNDTDDEFFLIDPKHGRNMGVRMHRCRAEQLNPTEWGSVFHTVACEDIEVTYNRYKNCALNARIDTWNKGVLARHNRMIFDDADALAKLNNESAQHSNYLGFYIGQNTYDFDISKNTTVGVYRPVYIEVGSVGRVSGNTFKSLLPKTWWNWGIIVQANWRNMANTFYGNASDIEICNNTIINFGTAVATSSELPQGRKFLHQELQISGNVIKGDTGHASIIISNTDSVMIESNTSKGHILLAACRGETLLSNSVNKNSEDSATYPIILRNSLSTSIIISGNTLRSATGAVLRLDGTSSANILLAGGALLPSTLTNFVSNVNWSGSIVGMGFAVGYNTNFMHRVVVNLPAGGVMMKRETLTGVASSDAIVANIGGLGAHVAQNPPMLIDVVAEAGDGYIDYRIINNSEMSVNFTAAIFCTVIPQIRRV